MKKLNKYPLSVNDVEIISEKILYQGFICAKKYALRFKRFGGGWSDLIEREVYNASRVAAILPYDPILDKLIMIEQFRAGALNSDSPWLLEIVAGIAEQNESTEEMIRRELKEESNLVALDTIKIYDYWVSPGASAEHLTLYCGRIDSADAEGIFGLEKESEDILVRVMDPDAVFELLDNNKIKNSVTIIAVQWFRLNKDKIRKQWSSIDVSKG
jgi:ADP-ribose pyrophosphatase